MVFYEPSQCGCAVDDRNVDILHLLDRRRDLGMSQIDDAEARFRVEECQQDDLHKEGNEDR